VFVKSFCEYISLGIIALALPCCTPSLPPEESKTQPSSVSAPGNRPNVVFILFDALRADHLGAYGYDRNTSQVIDDIAANGTLFEQHYAQANETVASLPTYMTGRYFPVFSQTQGSWRILAKTPSPNEKQLAEVFRENGYWTLAVSAHPFYLRGSRLYESFDVFHVLWSKPPEASALFHELLQDALLQLDTAAHRPFFMYIHAMDTHFPHYLKQGFTQWVNPNHPRGPELAMGGTPPYSQEDAQYLRGIYDNSICFADMILGQFLKELEARGLLDTTLFVISSDHGELLAEDGKTVGHPNSATADEVYHVPLILAGPGIPKNIRIKHFTESVDLLPTLVDLLGLKTDAEFQGKSLKSMMHGGDAIRQSILTKANTGSHLPPTIIWRNTHAKVMHTVKTDTYDAFQAPDRQASRVPISATPYPEAKKRLDDMEQWYQDYEALPYGAINVFSEYFPKSVQPETSVVRGSGEHWEDNLWDFNFKRLASCAWRENAPPVSFRIEVPNGTYRVELGMTTGEREGHPASAFAVRAENDSTFRTIVSDSGKQGHGTDRLAEIGVYTITDGYFDITLDEGSPDYWAVASYFRFVAQDIEHTIPSPLEDEQAREQLNALGYLGAN